MKDNLIIAAKLTLICFIAVVVLGLVNMGTVSKIAENKRIEAEKALNFFFEGKEFSKKNMIIPREIKYQDFNKSILSKIKNESDKKILQENYERDKSKNRFLLKSKISGETINKLYDILLAAKYKELAEEYYYTVSENGNVIGYVASVIGAGYGGDISLMVAFKKDLEIKNMKFITHAESSGFGDRWERQKAMNMFVGSNTKDYPFPESKSGVKAEFQNGPNGVTGATITFSAIIKAAKRSIKELENIE